MLDLSEKVHVYLGWFISYCDAQLKAKEFKDEHIVCHIFRSGGHTSGISKSTYNQPLVC